MNILIKGKEQANNTRRCRIIEFNGKKKNIQQWCIETGIHRNTFDYRVKRWGICGRVFYQKVQDTGRKPKPKPKPDLIK